MKAPKYGCELSYLDICNGLGPPDEGAGRDSSQNRRPSVGDWVAKNDALGDGGVRGRVARCLPEGTGERYVRRQRAVGENNGRRSALERQDTNGLFPGGGPSRQYVFDGGKRNLRMSHRLDVLVQRDHEDCRWPYRIGSAPRAGILEAVGTIDPISVGLLGFGDQSRDRTIRPQSGPRAVWRVLRSAARLGCKAVGPQNTQRREAPRPSLPQLDTPPVSVEPKQRDLTPECRPGWA